METMWKKLLKCSSCRRSERLRRFSSNRQSSFAEAEIARRAATWRAKFPDTAAAVMKPRVIFPWRHEDFLLPRLDPKDDEFILQGNYFGPGFPAFPIWYQWCVTHFTLHLIKAPWHRLIFGRWKQEFANSSAWAFSQAVAGVAANSFRVPFRDIRSENSDFMVNLDHLIQKPKKLDTRAEDESPDLEDMIEENLKTLYLSANKHGRDHLQINLQMRSTSSSILSAYCIPFLTREKVKNDPSLQNIFLDIYEKAEEHNGLLDASRIVFSELRRLGREQTECKTEHAVLASTIVVQVLIECEEIFQVLDVATGHVIQGSEDGKIRKIPHVMRLEAVISSRRSYDDGKVVTEIGAWQITDWDDLLSGNIWYL